MPSTSSAGGFQLKPFTVPSFTGPLGTSVSSGPGGLSGGTGGDDDDGDDEGEPILEPEKILRNEEDTDVQLHEVPCKLFKFKTESKEWVDLGKCMCRV
jgi:hypothetical protein